MKRKVLFPSFLFLRRKHVIFVLASVILGATAGYMLDNSNFGQALRASLSLPQFPSWKTASLNSPQFFSSNPVVQVFNEEALPAAPTVQEIETFINEQRLTEGVDALASAEFLEKYARLLTLEAADQQDLNVQNKKEILISLESNPPKEVDVLLLFLPKNQTLEELTTFTWESASQSSLLSKNFALIGTHVRETTLNDADGSLIAITVSSPQKISNKNSAPQKTGTSTTKPTFTGRDLWDAVQNYRRSHNLPEFAMSEELCTVASIRVNEQLTLGKLDNHDGFGKRSEEFFKAHPDWTSINENLAAGYDTAVQTVEWGWDQSLGHQALIKSREYPKACAAANSGFAVLITGK